MDHDCSNYQSVIINDFSFLVIISHFLLTFFFCSPFFPFFYLFPIIYRFFKNLVINIFIDEFSKISVIERFTNKF